MNNEPLLPEGDLLVTAMFAGLCDALAVEIIKLRRVTELLLYKGVIASNELTEAIQSIAQLPPEKAQEVSASLQQTMREQAAKHFAALRQFGQSGGLA